MKTSTLFRRLGMLALAGVIALAGWDLLRGEPDPMANAEESLRQRVDEYVQLRRDDDWIKLYEFADPRQRRSVGMKQFLNFYDHGLLKIVAISADQVHVDEAAQRATVQLALTAELDVENLPPKLRAGFREDHPEHLQKHMEHEMRWTWFGGEWFYLMDDEVVSGKDAQGNTILAASEGAAAGGK